MQFNDLGSQLAQIANEAQASGMTPEATAEVLLRYSQPVENERKASPSPIPALSQGPEARFGPYRLGEVGD